MTVDAARSSDVRLAESQLPAIVMQVTGQALVGARHMPYGHASITFEVDLGGRTVVVRTSSRAAAFAATARNLEVLGALGVPVPRLIAADLTQATVPLSWMVLEHIPGKDLGFVLGDLSVAEKRAIAAQVAEAQWRVRSGVPPAQSYGYGPIGQEPGRASFRAVIDEILTLANRTVPARLSSRVDAARSRLDDLAPYLDAVPPLCFLDDAQLKNVIVEDGHFRGIVDLDGVCYGDVLLCVGLTQTAAFCDVGEHALDYIDYLLLEMDVDSARREVVDAYSAVFTLEFLRDGQWTPAAQRRMLDAFDRWISGYR